MRPAPSAAARGSHWRARPAPADAHAALPQLGQLARLLRGARPAAAVRALPDVLLVARAAFVARWAREQEDLVAREFADVAAFAADLADVAASPPPSPRPAAPRRAPRAGRRLRAAHRARATPGA